MRGRVWSAQSVKRPSSEVASFPIQESSDDSTDQASISESLCSVMKSCCERQPIEYDQQRTRPPSRLRNLPVNNPGLPTDANYCSLDLCVRNSFSTPEGWVVHGAKGERKRAGRFTSRGMVHEHNSGAPEYIPSIRIDYLGPLCCLRLS